MRNKWFAILFSVLFLLMMIGAPTTLLLTKAGILPKENVGNKITPDKTYTEGSPLYDTLTAIEKAICLFRDEGNPGERFADTIARLGFDYVNEKLTNW